MVTPLGVFRATPAGLRLEALQPGATLADVTGRTGFAVETVPELTTLAPPTTAELAALEALDPERLRNLDFR